jgi:hypothetical protein
MTVPVLTEKEQTWIHQYANRKACGDRILRAKTHMQNLHKLLHLHLCRHVLPEEMDLRLCYDIVRKHLPPRE